MAVIAVLSAITAAAGAASSIVKLVNDIRGSGGTSDLDKGDLDRLADALTVMDQVPMTLTQMKDTMEAPAQKAILSRDDRPKIQQFLGTLADKISFQLEQIKAPLQTLEISKQKLTSAQVNSMREGANDLINSLKLDSGSNIKTAIERENLFTLALMVDNISVFATRDFANDSELRSALATDGRFTTSVGSYEDSL